VGWHQEYGIKAEFSSGSCGQPIYPPPIHRTLNVSNNRVDASDWQSEPTDPFASGAQTGIYLRWLCDSLTTVVDGDTTQFWKRGIWLDHAADTDVTCGDYRNNYIGVRYERKDALLPVGPGNDVVTFNQNAIKDNYRQGMELPYAHGLRIGDTANPPNPGRNSFQLDQDTGHWSSFLWVDVIPPSGPGTLVADHSTWRKHNGGIMLSALVPNYVEIANPPNAVSVNNKLTSDQLCGSVAYAGGPGEASAPDGAREGSGAEFQDGVPERVEFRLAGPNPARDRVRIAFGIPLGVDEPVALEVFDAAGRRVRDLVRNGMRAGRYDIHWDGRDAEGSLVATGTYFIRLTVGDFRETRKLTWIR
jgi:hypothetical protein